MFKYELIDNLQYDNKDIFDEKMSLLSFSEKEIVNRYKLTRDKSRSLAAYLSLNKLLGFVPEIETAKNGKRYIAGKDDIYFNISHSENLSLCVVSDKPVGCDIQKSRELRADIGPKVLTEGDCRFPIMKVWCAKESYVKLTGEGLRKEFSSFTADLERGIIIENGEEKAFLYEIDVPEDFYGFLIFCENNTTNVSSCT